ncbi:hypothetical protein [Actinomadura sp. 6N118]|uniref:hypothetical protein n=1 Tax=Actinomadura sp. 6N118 TaxID=3375151 RepID=UPI00378A4595
MPVGVPARPRQALAARHPPPRTADQHRQTPQAPTYETKPNISHRQLGNSPWTPAKKTSRPFPNRRAGNPGPIAGYTAAALPLLAQARAVLAEAVATDRAAGATWDEIAAVLEVSADTASRRYRS